LKGGRTIEISTSKVQKQTQCTASNLLADQKWLGRQVYRETAKKEAENKK
jgi:hypothetical protein